MAWQPYCACISQYNHKSGCREAACVKSARCTTALNIAYLAYALWHSHGWPPSAGGQTRSCRLLEPSQLSQQTASPAVREAPHRQCISC